LLESNCALESPWGLPWRGFPLKGNFPFITLTKTWSCFSANNWACFSAYNWPLLTCLYSAIISWFLKTPKAK
jgi:hypothetical protein